MRFVLRPQDTNVAHNVEPGKPGVARPSNTQNQPANDDVRDSLREWRQRWRQIMKDAIIYFDGIPPSQVDRLKSYLGVLGSQIQLFFDQKVTHVISENPRSDVAAKARDANRKVYTVEKLARFLGSLLGHSVTTALDASQSAKLAQMLEEDTRLSAAHAALYARKDDFHYFRGPYLLLWDPTRYNRPMCIKEWKPSANAEEGEWPQLRRAPMGMSPFTARSIVKSEKRKYHQQQQQSMRQHHQRVHKRQSGAYARDEEEEEDDEKEPNNNDDHEDDEDNDGAKHVTIEQESQRASQQFQQQRMVKRSRVPVLHEIDESEENKENMVYVRNSKQTRQAPCPAHTTNSTRLREFGEIVASGVPRYSQTSANPLSNQKDVAGSREMVNLRRKVMPRPHINTAATLSAADASGLADSGMRGTTPASASTATAPASIAAHAAPPMAIMASATPATGPGTGSAMGPGTGSGTGPATGPGTGPAYINIAPGEAAPGPRSRPQAVPRPKAKKPGYCENCLEKYEDLGEHLVSKRHKIFASTEQKFYSLDRVIETLQRPRRMSPELNERT